MTLLIPPAKGAAIISLILVPWTAGSAAAQAQVQAPTAAATLPTFSEADQLAAVKALCGDVQPGTAVDSISPSMPETVTGFVTENGNTIYVQLLSESYEENGVVKHLIVFGGHYVEDGEIASNEAARSELSAGIFELRNRKWTLIVSAAPLTEARFNGRDPAVALKQIGGQRHALEMHDGIWSAGNSIESIVLYEAREKAFAEILDVVTDANDCGSGDCCFEFDGLLEYDPKPGAAAYDLRVTLKGTYRNASGRIVRIPAGPIVLRYDNGEYAPVLKTPALRAMWEATQKPW